MVADITNAPALARGARPTGRESTQRRFRFKQNRTRHIHVCSLMYLRKRAFTEKPSGILRVRFAPLPHRRALARASPLGQKQLAASHCGRGETGRRKGLKIPRGFPCGFDPRRPHHIQCLFLYSQAARQPAHPRGEFQQLREAKEKRESPALASPESRALTSASKRPACRRGGIFELTHWNPPRGGASTPGVARWLAVTRYIRGITKAKARPTRRFRPKSFT